MRWLTSTMIVVLLTGCAASPTIEQRNHAAIEEAKARNDQQTARQKVLDDQRQADFDREWHEMHDSLPRLGDSDLDAKRKMQAQGYTFEKSYPEPDGEITESWVHHDPNRYAYVLKDKSSGEVRHVDVATIQELPRVGDDYFSASGALRDHDFRMAESTTNGEVILETWKYDGPSPLEPTFFSLARSNGNDFHSKLLRVSSTTLSH